MEKLQYNIKTKRKYLIKMLIKRNVFMVFSITYNGLCMKRWAFRSGVLCRLYKLLKSMLSG
jgi:hypothetical protein